MVLINTSRQYPLYVMYLLLPTSADRIHLTGNTGFYQHQQPGSIFQNLVLTKWISSLTPDWVLPTLFIPTKPSCPAKSIILLPHSATSEQLTSFKDLRKVRFQPSAVHRTFNAFCTILTQTSCSYIQQSHPVCGFSHYFVPILRNVLSHLKTPSFYHTLRPRSNSTI